jgi:glycosyltransferase 2 family protein
MKQYLLQLRLVFAAALVALLFYVVDFREVLRAFGHIRLEYLFYLALLTLVLIWISCIKWQMFIRAAGHEVPLVPLMKFYTMSYFFNMFLPSSLGGDMARSFQLGLRLKSHKSAFAATFVERLTGFLAMILMGVTFVAIGSRATAGVEAAVLLVAFVSLSGALVCFSETLSKLCFRQVAFICRLAGWARLANKLDKFFSKVSESIDFAQNDIRLFSKAMVLSVAFHLLAALNTYVCALAVGWQDAQYGSLCMVVPLVLLVSIAPITPGSVGIQEGAFLFFLIRVGATQGQGLGVALLLRAKNVITALFGGLLYLLSKTGKVQPEKCGSSNPC